MKNTFKYLAAAAAVVACAGSALAVPSGAALSISSGATTIVVQDNQAGDGSLTAGVVSWTGTINGWLLTVTSGVSKPVSGTGIAPNMDLAVQGQDAVQGVNPLGGLTIMFTDTDFGPTSAGVAHTTAANNGGAGFTSGVWIDTGNAQFAGVPIGSIINATLYSLTIVDTFTVAGDNSISTDDRVKTAPDGGTTAMLLGAALTMVGLLRKKMIA